MNKVKIKSGKLQRHQMFEDGYHHHTLDKIGSDPEWETTDSYGQVINAVEGPYDCITTHRDGECRPGDDCNPCDNCNPCDRCSGSSTDCDECDPREYICNGCDPCDGCDESYSSSSEDAYTAPIGLDHGDSVVEFRPEPGKTPTEAVANINNLFAIAEESGARFSAIGDRYAIGCHLHFGFKNPNGGDAGCRPHSHLLWLLDRFLGRPFKKLNGKGRGSYSDLGKYETKPYGFEYRSLPAAVFATPKIALIVHKIGYHIVKKYLTGEVFVLDNRCKNATVEEFKKYACLTDKQLVYMEKFVKSWRSMSYSKNITAFWRRGAKHMAASASTLPKFDITFSEDWVAQRRRALRSLIDTIRTSNRNVRILLYGLGDHRGDVIAGFNSPQYQTIDHVTSRTGDLIYALPYSFRNGYISPQNRVRLERDLISQIREDLKGLGKSSNSQEGDSPFGNVTTDDDVDDIPPPLD